MLPIKIHLTIMVICEFLGFLLGAVLVGSFWISGLLEGQIWLVALVALPALLIGTLIPRFVFRKLVSARCPKEGCLGHAFAQNSKPIIYVCDYCGEKIETNISDGDGGFRSWQ